MSGMSSAECLATAETPAKVPLETPLETHRLTGAEPRHPEHQVPRHVARHLLTGTSALGAAVVVERGLGFLANILAARLGGAPTFGAYALAISTAGNISTYAAGGIGATAARFSGKYPYGSAGYGTLARALAVVSLVSAAVAAGGLWLGAGPLALLLHKAALAHLLRWAALSAAGMIVLECARGFFTGQRRLGALLLLSLLVGIGMVTLVPLAATHHNPARMIMAQGAITAAPVLLCLLLARPLGLCSVALRGPAANAGAGLPVGASAGHGVLPVLREVWSFGMVQLAGLVGMNLAGWWLTTLVARADTTLVQMSFFAIANQMRNMAGLGPSLLTESGYALMAAEDSASEEKQRAQTPDGVMALCTYLSTASSLLISSIGILVVPWLLLLLYGSGYRAAAMTTALGFAIAVVHMGNAPAAARLSILSIRATGVINTLWALVVAAAGTLLLLHGGRAWEAMAVYLGGHLFSAALVLALLHRGGHVPAGMLRVFGLGTGSVVVLAVLACARAWAPQHTPLLSTLMLGLSAAVIMVLLRMGRRYRWLPGTAVLRQLWQRGMARLRPAGGAL